MTSSNPNPNRRDGARMPDDGNGSTRQKMKEDARDVKREVGAMARDTAQAGQQ